MSGILHDGCHVDPIQKDVDADALRDSSAAVLAVWGMGCPTCVLRVRNALLSLSGVLTADVDLHEGIARVRFDEASVETGDMVEAVARAGQAVRHRYHARVIS